MSAIYFIRHGQASIASTNYDQLSKKGMKQSEILGKSLKKRIPDIAQIQQGLLHRHQQTREYALAAMDVSPSIKVDEAWNEYDHVEIIHRYNPKYSSRTYMIADMTRKLNPRRDFELMFDGAMSRWLEGKEDKDYKETWTEFKETRIDAMKKLINSLDKSEKAIVFTSGGVIAALTQYLWNAPDEYFMQFNKKIVNCSITKVVKRRSEIFLSSWNDHGSLENHKGMITYV